jgi:hypothetical protein
MVRLVLASASVALTMMLFAGCGGGGGDDPAKVEASLQRYLVSAAPEDVPFPIGAGAPRVKDNGCSKLEKGSTWPNPLDVPPPARFARWNCVVEAGTLATPVTVAVNDSTEIVAATQGGWLPRHTPG